MIILRDIGGRAHVLGQPSAGKDTCRNHKPRTKLENTRPGLGSFDIDGQALMITLVDSDFGNRSGGTGTKQGLEHLQSRSWVGAEKPWVGAEHRWLLVVAGPIGFQTRPQKGKRWGGVLRSHLSVTLSLLGFP